MKKLLVLVSTIFAGMNLFAQGTVNFGNRSDAAVFDGTTGAKLVAGNRFIAELWYAPDTGGPAPTTSDMVALTGARTGIGPVAGLFTGGTKTTPNTTAPGGAAYFQVRIWEAAFGADWATASTAPGSLSGCSDIIRVTTGNPGAVPPGTPGSLMASGLKSFTLLGFCPAPEPSVVAFGLLGAGALIFLRRRK